jgi:hypothetical protein
MNYWATLHNPSDAENIKAGAHGLLRLAVAATSSSLERQAGRRNIRLIEGQMTDPDMDDMETDENDT